MKSVLLIAVLLFSGWVSTTSAATLERADGSHITYHLDSAEGTAQHGLLLMLQGSGCEPVAERNWRLTDPPILAPKHAVLLIEKYGVPAAANDTLVDGCTSAYWSGNTLSRRTLDVLQVVASLRHASWWNGELVVWGGSEGGAVAAIVAPLLPEARAVVIQSSGIGVPVKDLIRSAVPPPVADQLGKILAEATLNPTGQKRFAGASYRWWADAADMVPARALLQTDVPVLLIHGTRDRSAPVATARQTRDLMTQRGKQTLTYREYEGYDHFMVDAIGTSRQFEVLADAARWIEQTPTVTGTGLSAPETPSPTEKEAIGKKFNPVPAMR